MNFNLNGWINWIEKYLSKWAIEVIFTISTIFLYLIFVSNQVLNFVGIPIEAKGSTPFLIVFIVLSLLFISTLVMLIIKWVIFRGEWAESLESKLNEHDEKLFRKFLESLPSNGSIVFLDQFNMAGFPFDTDELSDTDRFVREWDDAGHHFNEQVLEEKRQKLIHLIKKYNESIATNTYPTDSGLQSVPREWETEQPTSSRTQLMSCMIWLEKL